MTHLDLDALRSALAVHTHTEQQLDDIMSVVTTATEASAPAAGGVLDDVRAALARPGELSEHDAGFYRRLIDSIDQVMSERERLHTAWTSARRRARSARTDAAAERSSRVLVENLLRGVRAELASESARVSAARYGRDEARQDLSAARMECEELRRALRSALSSPDTPGVHTTLSHMRRLAGLDGADLIHVATPEGITPCGAGVHDVATTAIIREATCLECVSSLAQATHGDALPEEDLVEQGDEVPALAELADRVTALEELTRDQANLLEGHSRDLEAIRKPPAPARYRDREGDLWERDDTPVYRLVEVRGNRLKRPSATRSLEYLNTAYGPLTPVAAETAGGAE